MNHLHQFLVPFAQRQRGLSLLEILVALVISLFLLAGVIQLFIGSKQTYRFHDALSRVQENGRFAVEAMARDIRMAGYQPVGGTATITAAVNGTGNDQIAVAWSDDGINTLSRTYSLATGVGGKSALHLQRESGPAQELVEGVEQMQITYGEDTDNDPHHAVDPPYKGAGTVVNWNNVVSVRIHLLLASVEENVVTTNQTVTFPPGSGTTVTIPNRRLPQIFSTTVGIRNRLP
jgi:type IV pilus assembly protein PilW